MKGPDPISMSSDTATSGASTDATRGHYDWTASIYDNVVELFTGGQNRKCKVSQVAQMQPGDRVLYVGVGPGEDAIEAARSGIKVTCIDLSEGMIGKVLARFQAAGLPGEFVCDDIMEHEPAELYDAVVTNYFLNVFSPPVMEQMLATVVKLVRPGGKLFIADFAPPRGNILLRWMQRAYWRVTIVSHWMVGLAALHPIYDYTTYLPDQGMTPTNSQYFRLFKIGPWLFRSLTAVREEEPDAVPYPPGE